MSEDFEDFPYFLISYLSSYLLNLWWSSLVNETAAFCLISLIRHEGHVFHCGVHV